ncbi:MAG: T9SS type A sorting domain-containing protein [Flavobacterium sp.]
MKQNSPTKTSALLLLALFLFTPKSLSQTPMLDFAKVLETNHDQGVWSRATVTDTEGNFYMTGLFHGTVDFDPDAGSFPLVYQGGTLNDTDGESDVFIAKYNPNGELIWAKRLIEPTFTGMNEERGSSIIIDDNNNLFLSGFTNTRGFFVSKWSNDGNEIWTRYFDDAEANGVTTFAIRKKDSSVLISGIFAGTVDFDPSVQINELTAFNNDGFLLSLSENGNFEWVKQFRCNGGVIMTGLEVDSANNIFLSGVFLGTVDLNPDPNVNAFITSQSVSTGAISSAFIAKYNSNGELLWNRHLRGTASTDFFMTFIKKDSNDNIIVTGSFKGIASFLSTPTTLNTGNFYASFLAKYDTTGSLLWANLFGTPTATQTTFFPSSFCANVILDSCNNIYVSGEFQGNCDFNPAAGENIESALTNLIGAFAAAYSPDGNYLWSMNIGGPGNVTFVEFNGYLPIALDNNNDLIFTGTFRQQLDFDPSTSIKTLTSSSSNPNIAGVFMAKYDNPINNCQLGVNGFEKSRSFSVYPNPSNGFVTIAVKEIAIGSALNVYDISGKKLLSAKVDSESTTLDLGNFADGVYIIEINDGSKTFHQKLILK